MKKNKTKLAFIICALLFNIGVFAQGPPGGRQGGGRGQGQGRNEQPRGKPDASEILSMLDTDNNNVIDRDEASKDKRGKIAEDFDEIDTNEDGVIDLDELKVSLNNRKPKKISADKVLKTIDDDNDGKLNALEVAAKGKQDLIDNFNKIDSNEDQLLDVEELKVYFTSKQNEKPKRKRR